MMHFSLSDNCVCHFNIKILNLFDPELQLINTILIIKNKLKELLNQLKESKLQSILQCKKRNYCKIPHLSANDSDIDEAFKFMQQKIMTKMKNFGSKSSGV